MPGLPARSSVQRLPLPNRRRANFQRESPRRTRTAAAFSTAGESGGAGNAGAPGTSAAGPVAGATGAIEISAGAVGIAGTAIGTSEGITGSGRMRLGAAGVAAVCGPRVDGDGTTAMK